MKPVTIRWRCTWCGVVLPLPALWEHLRESHGWDRDEYQAASDRPRMPRGKVVTNLPLGPYRWRHEEE